MNDHSIQSARTHNTVVGIITVACLGTISGSSVLQWEYWVPPLIVAGLIAAWFLHITQYGTRTFRENYYLIFTMLISFFHGVHATSFWDIVVVSALLMVNVTLLRRREFVMLMLIEYFVLQITQVVMGMKAGTLVFDTLTVARLSLHVIAELCIYKGLSDVIRNNRMDTEEAERLTREKQSVRSEMEDFLVNLSHELRTPINVINGMSTLILKKEEREDVQAIRDAGLRLSRQIEDIQDYSEIQRGDVQLEEERYMITSLLNDIVTEFRIRESESDRELVVDLDPNVPVMLKGDARKLSKILRHLLDNAVKFTRIGGINLRITAVRKEYGVNLVLEVSDTGIGMSRTEIDRISRGLYQENRKRDRSTGGIGLGLSIVYGFVRRMNGFVNLESRKGKGTTVRVCVAQEIIDPSPCLSVDTDRFVSTAVYLNIYKFRVPELAEYYRQMVVHLATGLRLNLYSAPTLPELKRLVERGGITNIFTGPEEYQATPDYYDALAANGVLVAVSAPDDFSVRPGSRVIVMPKPLSGCPVVRILSGEIAPRMLGTVEEERRPELSGVRALVVDDEPMNLVVARGLFRNYRMVIDTALSGREAIEKCRSNDYDVVFMDHMMPEMDGVEAMKHIKEDAQQRERVIRVVALTANAISGAREMFLREGFDGFISKPIHLSDFERTMNRILPESVTGREGGSV